MSSLSSSVTRECEQLTSELRSLEHVELLSHVEQLHTATTSSRLHQQNLLNTSTSVGRVKGNFDHLEPLMGETDEFLVKLNTLKFRLKTIEKDGQACSRVVLFTARVSRQEVLKVGVALMHLWMAIVNCLFEMVITRDEEVVKGLEEAHEEDLRFVLHAVDAFNRLVVLWRGRQHNNNKEMDEEQENMEDNLESILSNELREITTSRLMLIMAKERAEYVARSLTQVLSFSFDKRSLKQAINDVAWIQCDDDDDHDDLFNSWESGSTSLRATSKATVEDRLNAHLSLTHSLVCREQEYIDSFIHVVAKVPGLRPLGQDKLSKSVRMRMADFYHTSLWHRVGALASRLLHYSPSLMRPQTALGLANLVQEHLEAAFEQGYSQQVLPAMHLIHEHLILNALTNAFDQHMANCLIALDHKTSISNNQSGSRVGEVFLRTVEALVRLNNRCHPDMVRDFVEHGEHDPDEFPFVEEMHVLNRLKATLVTWCNYGRSRGREALDKWRLDHFVAITQTDAKNIENALQRLQLARHERAAHSKLISVQLHVHVQATLVRQIERCQRLIRTLPTNSQSELFAVCKTNALATLHNHFPGEKHWRSKSKSSHHQNHLAMNNFDSNGWTNTSGYVKVLLHSILQPLFKALESTSEEQQQTLGRIGIKALCEAWLQHILSKKFKFSENGGELLSSDFKALRGFVATHASIGDKAKNYLLLLDSLRECEGVADILACNNDNHTHNDHNNIHSTSINNNAVNHVGGTKRNQVSPATNGVDDLVARDPRYDSSSVEQVLDVIPARLYVHNKEAWIALRLHTNSILSFKRPPCCT